MKLKIYSVYDSKAGSYLQPFYAPTRGVALRMFENAALSDDHDFGRFSADFTLFELGEFDQNEGKFELLEAHENLGTALRMRMDSAEGVADLTKLRTEDVKAIWKERESKA